MSSKPQNKRIPIPYDQSKKIGERLREQANNRRISVGDMCGILGYQDVQNVYAAYSGNFKTIPSWVDRICKEWDLRREYVLCLDDYETQEKLFSVLLKDADMKNDAPFFEYLQSIGVKLSFELCWSTDEECFFEECDNMKHFLKECDIFLYEQVFSSYDDRSNVYPSDLLFRLDRFPENMPEWWTDSFIKRYCRLEYNGQTAWVEQKTMETVKCVMEGMFAPLFNSIIMAERKHNPDEVYVSTKFDG